MVEGITLIAFDNLFGKKGTAVIETDAMNARPPETLLGEDVEAAKDGKLRVSLKPYDFRWLCWRRQIFSERSLQVACPHSSGSNAHSQNIGYAVPRRYCFRLTAISVT